MSQLNIEGMVNFSRTSREYADIHIISCSMRIHKYKHIIYTISQHCAAVFCEAPWPLGGWLPRSSPADLPVPTQMPSPSAAFRDEEVVGKFVNTETNAGRGNKKGMFRRNLLLLIPKVMETSKA